MTKKTVNNLLETSIEKQTKRKVEMYFENKLIKEDELFDRSIVNSLTPVVYLDDNSEIIPLNIQLEEAYKFCHNNGYENVVFYCDAVVSTSECSPTYKYNYYKESILPLLVEGGVQHLIFYSIEAMPHYIYELLYVASIYNVKIDFIHFDDDIEYTSEEEEVLQYYLAYHE